MKILYAALKYDYGDPARGYSYEHYNFYESLHHMGHDVLYFDLGDAEHRTREASSKRLMDVVRSEKPDLLFSVLQQGEVDPLIMQRISAGTSTLTLNWFCDDHWRFETFSSRWAFRFNWIVTTARDALPKYRALGYANVIKSQWACNQARYHPLDVPQQYDVTFVGMPHGDRRFTVEALRREGIDVQVWGKGWERGRISQDEMISLFNKSRINLNLSNSSPPGTLASRAVDAATRLAERAPLTAATRERAARALAVLRHQVTPRNSRAYPDQIKGRNFEVPGCAGFLLTGWADNLEDYYVPAHQVACFSGLDDLARQIRYYLRNPDERAAIAMAGYKRTISEHTYAHRFSEIFQRLELPSAPVGAILAGHVAPGASEEIL